MFVILYCPLDKRYRVANSWTGIMLPARRNMRGFKNEGAALRYAAKRERWAVKFFRRFS